MVEVVGTLWTAIEFGYEIFVRARLINNSFFYYVQIHQAQNYFSREEIMLFFRTLLGGVHVLLN